MKRCRKHVAVQGFAIAVATASIISAGDRWDGLISHNPFEPVRPPAPVAPLTPSPYEFRGMTVENGVRYFSLYNLETKKGLWITDSRGRDGLRVESHDSNGLLVADASGRTVRLPLKQIGSGTMAPTTRHLPTSLASAAVPSAFTPTAIANLAEPESARQQRVADQIRLRRSQRLLAKG